MSKGVSLLIVVLIIGAAGLAMAVSSVWLGVSERELAQVADGAVRAKLTAESCLENALWRLRINPAYGGESLSLEAKSCIITVVNQGGSPNPRTVIESSATAGDYHQVITATVEQLGEKFKIISWQEN